MTKEEFIQMWKSKTVDEIVNELVKVTIDNDNLKKDNKKLNDTVIALTENVNELVEQVNRLKGIESQTKKIREYWDSKRNTKIGDENDDIIFERYAKYLAGSKEDTVYKIAKDLGLSQSVVIYRLKRVGKYINKYTIQPNENGSS